MTLFRNLPPIRRSSRLLAIAGAAALLAAAARAQEPEPVVAGTLPEDYLPGLRSILDTALKQSPSMIANELLIAAADASRGMSGVAPMLPSVSFGPGYGKSIETVSGGSGATNGETGLLYNAGIRQPIFEWGTLKNQLQIQKTAELITEKNYAEGYRVFVGTLRRQYMALIVEKIDLRNARYALELSTQALAVARDKLKHGVIPSNDVAPLELDTDEKQLAVDKADQAYRFARRTLAHEVGRPDLDDDSIPQAIPAPRYSDDTSDQLLAGMLREGGRDTLAAQIDQLNIRQEELAFKIAKVRLLPQFYATAGISQQNDTFATSQTVQQTLVTNTSYYLNASWTLFDGFATHWAKLQALAEKHRYERLLEVDTDSAMDQAENSRRTVGFAWRALGLAQRHLEMAQGGLAHLREEFKLGNVPQDQVEALTGGVYLYESAINAARSDFLAAWSDFVSLVGADPAMSHVPVHYVRDLR